MMNISSEKRVGELEVERPRQASWENEVAGAGERDTTIEKLKGDCDVGGKIDDMGV